MAIAARLPRDLVIVILKHRGYTNLRTSVGVRPLEQCPEYQLNAVYRAGKTVVKKGE